MRLPSLPPKPLPHLRRRPSEHNGPLPPWARLKPLPKLQPALSPARTRKTPSGTMAEISPHELRRRRRRPRAPPPNPKSRRQMQPCPKQPRAQERRCVVARLRYVACRDRDPPPRPRPSPLRSRPINGPRNSGGNHRNRCGGALSFGGFAPRKSPSPKSQRRKPRPQAIQPSVQTLSEGGLMRLTGSAGPV